MTFTRFGLEEINTACPGFVVFLGPTHTHTLSPSEESICGLLIFRTIASSQRAVSAVLKCSSAVLSSASSRAAHYYTYYNPWCTRNYKNIKPFKFILLVNNSTSFIIRESMSCSVSVKQ
ncbi:hypothetical protein J6590_067150 [Homalodisca vitripennis]|nr:hypothetical protein J6590_067150 [Homalodisca vitripennis]